MTVKNNNSKEVRNKKRRVKKASSVSSEEMKKNSAGYNSEQGKENEKQPLKDYLNPKSLQFHIYLSILAAIATLVPRVYFGFNSLTWFVSAIFVSYISLFFIFVLTHGYSFNNIIKNRTLWKNCGKIASCYSVLIGLFIVISVIVGLLLGNPTFKDLTINPDLNNTTIERNK